MYMYIWFFAVIFSVLIITGMIEHRDKKRQKKRASELARLQKSYRHRMIADAKRQYELDGGLPENKTA